MIGTGGSWTSQARLGAIEAGGTKFVCATGTPGGEILHLSTMPTSEPVETMERVIEFFRSQSEPIHALGIGSFGPVQLNPQSPQYGFITSTPKPGWAYFDLLGTIQRAMRVPVAFNTDVNAAALGEYRWGAAQGLRNFLYVTVGTGIGGGAMIDGRHLQGHSHLEMGHVRVPHDPIRDPFPGICPYHGDCLEGLTSGPAIEARWGVSPRNLPLDHRAWELAIEYLALGCVNWICTLSPEAVIVGGGVMRPELFPALRIRVRELLNNYLDLPHLQTDGYLLPPGLGSNAGVLGALALAAREAGLG